MIIFLVNLSVTLISLHFYIKILNTEDYLRENGKKIRGIVTERLKKVEESVTYKLYYAYEWNGKSYKNNNWVLAELYEKYKKGDRIEVYIDIEDPEESVIAEKGIITSGVVPITFVIIFGIVTISMFFAIILSWRYMRRQKILIKKARLPGHAASGRPDE